MRRARKAFLLDNLRVAGSISKECHTIWKAPHQAASWVRRKGVARAAEVLGNAQICPCGLVLGTMALAAIMSDREAVIATKGSSVNSSSGVTRVMIVDDHPVLRKGLRASLLFFAEFEIVGEAGSGEEALRLLDQMQPDIILMDLLMPGMGGVAAIRLIREIAPDTKILVLSTYEEGDLVQEALKAGAIGYQLKGMEIDELVTAIRQAVRGVPTLAPAAAQALVRNTTKTPMLGNDLTDREREVLALLAKGLSNAAIADRMVVTVATVKFHLRSIRAKLGTKTRTETVALALQLHLI